MKTVTKYLIPISIVASLVLHIMIFVVSAIDWQFGKEKQEYMDSDVLLMGENTGTKINPPKVKNNNKIKAPVDANAPKVYDKNAGDDQGEAEVQEGTFGQGGTKELEYLTELNAWLAANKKYPKLARRLGQECENIVVSFNLYPDGRLDDIVLTEKCQYEVLNQATVDLVKASSPFKPFPAHYPKTPLKRSQAFAFKLED